MATSREVINALLRNRPPFERVGLQDGPWHDTLEKWVAEEGYPTDEKDRPVAAVDHFGFDMAGLGAFDPLPIRGYEEILDETDEWKIVRNGAGGALKWWKRKSGTPEHIDFRMTSREIWEKNYRAYLLEVDRERLALASKKEAYRMRREQGKWVFFGGLFIFELMRRSFGDVCMYESLLLDPDWIHDYNRVYTDFYKAHYGILIEEVGRPDGIWIYEDLGYSNGLFCSPSMLGEMIFPYYAELVEFFHGYDLPVVLHSCGGVTEGLPLVVEAGFDGLHPMEVKAGCDLLAFARDRGDALTFIGGLDIRVLESGDRDLIRRETERIVTGMKELGGRYVFGSDHSVSSNVGYGDYAYAIDVYREHMTY
ncbi:MAG: uroporphyrinogen decarboxylase family protein [Candidatus Latescibacteria bacterium]|jgi:uroporphyrinogen decarboxylase|nr:uroporphyrinogen decarboxylase family protein [Candidatus Latescibacterota bacterium]